jgi:hypothetical protein
MILTVPAFSVHEKIVSEDAHNEGKAIVVTLCIILKIYLKPVPTILSVVLVPNKIKS